MPDWAEWGFKIGILLAQVAIVFIGKAIYYAYKQDQNILHEKVTDHDKRMDKLDENQIKIERNYLDRFAEVNKNMETNHRELMKEISDIKVNIAGMR